MSSIKPHALPLPVVASPRHLGVSSSADPVLPNACFHPPPFAVPSSSGGLPPPVLPLTSAPVAAGVVSHGSSVISDAVAQASSLSSVAQTKKRRQPNEIRNKQDNQICRTIFFVISNRFRNWNWLGWGDAGVRIGIGWGGGSPLIEHKNTSCIFEFKFLLRRYYIPHSCFLQDIDPIFKISKN